MLTEMKGLFKITERQLISYLDYVPIRESHLRVVSPYLFNFMAASGTQIEPMMVKLVELLSPQQIDQNQGDLFGECFRHLNRAGMLMFQKVITKEKALTLQPFMNSNPDWWQAYNSHIKHGLPEGMEKATLGNSLNLHASLFILHSIASLAFEQILSYPDVSYKMKPEQVMDREYWVDLQEGIEKGEIPSRIVMDYRSSEHKARRLNFQEAMRRYTKFDSEIFDYVAVLNPTKFGAL